MHNIDEIRYAMGSSIADMCHELKASIEIFTNCTNVVWEDEDVNLYQIFTNASRIEVSRVVAKYFPPAKESIMPGCMYRHNVNIVSCFDKEGIAYYIVDRWRIADE